MSSKNKVNKNENAIILNPFKDWLVKNKIILLIIKLSKFISFFFKIEKYNNAW